MKGQNSIANFGKHVCTEKNWLKARLVSNMSLYYNFSYMYDMYESLFHDSYDICEKTEHVPIIPKILVIMKFFNGRVTLIFNSIFYIYISIPE